MTLKYYSETCEMQLCQIWPWTYFSPCNKDTSEIYTFLHFWLVLRVSLFHWFHCNKCFLVIILCWTAVDACIDCGVDWLSAACLEWLHPVVFLWCNSYLFCWAACFGHVEKTHDRAPETALDHFVISRNCSVSLLDFFLSYSKANTC
jgi:hypothetical protein